MAVYNYSEFLAKRFILASEFGDVYSLARRVGDMLHVPRGLCDIGAEDLRTDGLPAKFDKLKFEPRNDDQARASKEINGYLAQGRSFTVSAPTGSGKTVLGCVAIASVGRVALVVVTKSDLMKRWKDDFQKILGLTPSEIGTIQGDVFNVVGKKVIVGMVDSLADFDKYPSWFKATVGFVIFDEVHRMGAPTFMRTTMEFPARLRLGLSATVDRRDGKSIVFEANIGPVLVRIDSSAVKFEALCIETEWKCPRTQDGSQVPHGAGRDMHIRKIMSRNAKRNTILAKVISLSYAKQRSIVMFTDLLDHVDAIHSLLPGYKVPYDVVGCYSGSLKEKDREIALAKPIILTTYKMMSEGTDVPTLDTCVLGMPRADVRQPIGRVLRPCETSKDRRVVDLVDNDSGIYRGYALARRSYYRRTGALITDVHVD